MNKKKKLLFIFFIAIFLISCSANNTIKDNGNKTISPELTPKPEAIPEGYKTITLFDDEFYFYLKDPLPENFFCKASSGVIEGTSIGRIYIYFEKDNQSFGVLDYWISPEKKEYLNQFYELNGYYVDLRTIEYDTALDKDIIQVLPEYQKKCVDCVIFNY
ncbi:hypothetical protein [Anaerorhabdus sp.]|uniref:hypothetical protein n=1 Tax=Anaerorhabdus sp. TaxID=1872524 RepID=UPI002FCACDB8